MGMLAYRPMDSERKSKPRLLPASEPRGLEIKCARTISRANQTGDPLRRHYYVVVWPLERRTPSCFTPSVLRCAGDGFAMGSRGSGQHCQRLRDRSEHANCGEPHSRGGGLGHSSVDSRRVHSQASVHELRSTSDQRPLPSVWIVR